MLIRLYQLSACSSPAVFEIREPSVEPDSLVCFTSNNTFGTRQKCVKGNARALMSRGVRGKGGRGGLSKAAAIYTDEAVSLLFFTRTHRCDLLPRFHSAAASVSLWSCCLFPRPLLFTARVLGLHFNPESSAKSPRTSISLSPLGNEIRWHLSGVGCLGEVA